MIIFCSPLNFNQVQILRPSGMGKSQSDPEHALESLEHAAECDDKSCGSEGCIKFESVPESVHLLFFSCRMKMVISHAEACWKIDEKSENSCLICKNVRAEDAQIKILNQLKFANVCRKHANMCITADCRVLNCKNIKSRLYEIEEKIEAAQKLRRQTA